MEIVRVSSKNEFKSKIRELLADNFVVQQQDEDSAVLSRKKKFNWILAIICAFIPIFGWIALIWMIFAATRGADAKRPSVQALVAAVRNAAAALPVSMDEPRRS